MNRNRTVAGLDVHKDSIYFCIMRHDEAIIFEKTYGVLTPDLRQMCNDMVAQGVTEAAVEECGPRRKNEDYIAVREMPEQERLVFVLCDGMGGHHLGEVASKLVAEHICDYWTKNTKRKDRRKSLMPVMRQ